MDFPKDCPAWVESLFNDIEDKVERDLASAVTSELAMKASGAMKLWREIKSEVDLQYKKMEHEVKQRNERLNARTAH